MMEDGENLFTQATTRRTVTRVAVPMTTGTRHAHGADDTRNFAGHACPSVS